MNRIAAMPHLDRIAAGGENTELRPELGPLPDRMRALPVDPRGFVVPWFVPQLADGTWEFRALDAQKLARAIQFQLCWVCGQRLGAFRSFTVGPMCMVSGTNGEPPSHFACATYSAKHCPFLTRPHMRRRETDIPEEASPPAGIGIARNPGVCAVVTLREFEVFDDGGGKPLFAMKLDTIEHVEWYAGGRAATRAEVEESVRTGL